MAKGFVLGLANNLLLQNTLNINTWLGAQFYILRTTEKKKIINKTLIKINFVV